jgi:hypothetical protein
MGSQALYQIIETDQSPSEIREAVKKAFVSVGGYIQDTPQAVVIHNGKQGITFSELADFTAHIQLHKLKENKYQLICYINWKPSVLNWVLIFLGIFVLGIAWIYSFLYIFIKPEQPYLRALQSVEKFLE